MKKYLTAGSTRSGYTLIELLIASVIVTTLMSTVWGLMSMYNSLLSAGQAKVTEQQLVRSLFQLISEDLSTALTPLDERKITELVFSDEDAILSDFQDLEEEELFERSVLENTKNSANPAAPIFLGTSTAIRITTHKVIPHRRESELSDIDLLNELGGGSVSAGESSEEGQSPHVSEFQSVVYQFQFPDQNASGDSLPAGLYRIQVNSLDLYAILNDRTTLQQSRADDDVQMDRFTLESLLFPQTDQLEEVEESEFETETIVPGYDLVPEVVGCQFEYFDGRSWVSQWPVGENSDVSYPAAIRIRLDVINTEELEKLTELESPTQELNDLEQELNDSFSVETDRAFNNSDLTDEETDPSEISPFAGIRPRSYWRIILLESPNPKYDSFGLGNSGSSSMISGESFE